MCVYVCLLIVCVSLEIIARQEHKSHQCRKLARQHHKAIEDKCDWAGKITCNTIHDESVRDLVKDLFNDLTRGIQLHLQVSNGLAEANMMFILPDYDCTGTERPTCTLHSLDSS